MKKNRYKTNPKAESNFFRQLLWQYFTGGPVPVQQHQNGVDRESQISHIVRQLFQTLDQGH